MRFLSRTRRRAVVLAVAASAVVAAVPTTQAGADGALPSPCTELLFKDAAGDAEIGPILGNDPSGGASTPAPENLDVLGAFVNTRNGVTTANIRIKNLTKEVPAEMPNGVVSYVFDFKRHESGYVNLRARNERGTITFQAHKGERIDAPANPTERTLEIVETKGRFLEGPDGIIEIEFPPEMAAAGTKLEAVWVNVSMRDGYVGVGYVNDQAPDGGEPEGRDLTVAECPAAPLGGLPAPGEVAAPTTLPVKVVGSLGSAKKARKTRSLGVKLTASQPVTALVAELRSGKKVVAKGSLKQLSGTTTLKLKFKSKPNSGKLTLVLAGTVSGTRLSSTHKVKLAK